MLWLRRARYTGFPFRTCSASSPCRNCGQAGQSVGRPHRPRARLVLVGGGESLPGMADQGEGDRGLGQLADVSHGGGHSELLRHEPPEVVLRHLRPHRRGQQPQERRLPRGGANLQPSSQSQTEIIPEYSAQQTFAMGQYRILCFGSNIKLIFSIFMLIALPYLLHVFLI